MAGGTLKAPALRYVELTVRKSSAGKGFAGQLHITTRSTWRHFGLFAGPRRQQRLALCQRLLGMPPAAPDSEPPTDYRDRFEALTGRSLRTCPACGRGTMETVEAVPPGSEPPPLDDTS